MNRPANPLAPIVPVTPPGDRRPSFIRPAGPGPRSVFGGWGPKI